MTTPAVERTHTTLASDPRYCPVCKADRKVAICRVGSSRTVRIPCPECASDEQLLLVLEAWEAS